VSQIFDALQRSEAERSGIESSGLAEATEMLQRAEHLAASEWEANGLSQLSAAKGAEHDISFGRAGATPIAMASEAPATTELSRPDECLNPFDQFQSLQVSLAAQSRLISLTDKGSPTAEAFRLLVVRLRQLRRDRALKKLLITSTIPQEGKSVVAANLACTLALGTQQRVLVLDGDLRRPSLSQMFGLKKPPGLCERLQGDRSLMASIYHLEEPKLWILPSGSAPSNALELLQSGKLSTLMDQLAAWFDWIIIDSPPVLPLADTSVWMRFADGILLITRQGVTEKRQLERGLEAIEPKKLIGAVMNGSKDAATNGYYCYRPETISGSND
jgi:capsular exopolysaccharide synthesis family protein